MRTTTGIVMAVPSSGRIAVLAAGALTARTIPCTRDVAAAAAVGDQVLITAEGRQMWATGVLAVGAAVAVTQDPYRPASPETTTVLTGVAGLIPVWAGTWDGAGWRPDLPGIQCGANPGSGILAARRGAVFYGRQLHGYGLLTAARLRLSRTTLGTAAATTVPLSLLAGSGDQPASYPSVLDTVSGPVLAAGGSDDWQLPAAWLPRLGAGGDAGGIGVGAGSATPYLAVDRPQLTIDWKRG